LVLEPVKTFREEKYILPLRGIDMQFFGRPPRIIVTLESTLSQPVTNISAHEM